MPKLWHTVKHEFLEVLPPTIFFFITFRPLRGDREAICRRLSRAGSSSAPSAQIREVI